MDRKVLKFIDTLNNYCYKRIMHLLAEEINHFRMEDHEYARIKYQMHYYFIRKIGHLTYFQDCMNNLFNQAMEASDHDFIFSKDFIDALEEKLLLMMIEEIEKDSKKKDKNHIKKIQKGLEGLKEESALLKNKMRECIELLHA